MNQGNGNGQKPPMQFPSGAVPIVGQPFTVKAVRFFLVLSCNNCQEKHPVLVGINESVSCPGCKRILTVKLKHIQQLLDAVVIGMSPAPTEAAAQSTLVS